MTNKLILVNNAGMIELERTITSLYAKRLVSKIEIKELIASLKMLVDALPDNEETYLH